MDTIMTCAFLTHTKSGKVYSFNLRLTEKQASDFLDVRGTHESFEDSLRTQLCLRFGFRTRDYSVRILPPHGTRHHEYIERLSKLPQVFVEASAIDL